MTVTLFPVFGGTAGAVVSDIVQSYTMPFPATAFHVQVRVGVAAIFWVGEGFDCSVEIR